MSKYEAGRVAARFTSDRLSIQRQLDFQKRRATIFVSEIAQHNETLSFLGLEQLSTRDALGLPPQALFDDEIKSWIPHVNALLPKLESAYSDLIGQVEELSERLHHNDPFDYVMNEEDDVDFSFLGEWNEWLRSTYSPKQLTEMSSESISECIKQAIASADNEVEPLPEWSFNYMADEAKQGALNDLAASVFELQDRFEEFRIIAESGEPSAPLGIMRQSFIALMASFDAAIFDLVRLAFKKDFFPLMAKIEKKLSMDFSQLNTWDELRESLVETQLRKQYAVGWVHTLNSNWKVFGRNPNSEFSLPRIFEQFRRRNVHLHNRGIVDEQYVSDFNLDRLNVGQVALVTDDYLQRASELNEHIVHHVAKWVVSL